MKITVEDDSNEGAFGAMQVRIKDLSAEIERITVKVLGLHLPTRRIEDVRERTGSRKQFRQGLFARMLSTVQLPHNNVPPLVDAELLTPAAATAPANRTIEIKLSLPTLSDWPSLTTLGKKLLSWPLYRALAAVLVIALVVVATTSPFGDKTANAGDKPKAPSTHSGAPTLARGAPKYSTVLPGGKSIASLGGWARVSPPDHNPVYAYVDHVGRSQLNVSEQPLPDNFKTDTANQIANLATGFNATEKVTAKDHTLIYLGTSANGPQTAIFTKSKLLILIKTTAPLSNNQWVTYVSSLQ